MSPDAPLSESAARAQARKEREFYAHLAKFLVVMAGLIALNLVTSPSYLWFFWPLLGWGFGLAKHGAHVFGTSIGGGWVDRRTRELMGTETSEARLRALLDETLDERALPAGPPQDLARLQRRIEHLEAIVTATDGDPFVPGHRAADTPRLDLDALGPAPTEPGRVSETERAGRTR